MRLCLLIGLLLSFSPVLDAGPKEPVPDIEGAQDKEFLHGIRDLFRADPARKAERQARKEDRREEKEKKRALRRKKKAGDGIVVDGEDVYYEGMNVNKALKTAEWTLSKDYARLKKLKSKPSKKQDQAEIRELEAEILELENTRRGLDNIRREALGLSEEKVGDLESSQLDRDGMEQAVGRIQGFGDGLGEGRYDDGSSGAEADAGGGSSGGGFSSSSGGSFDGGWSAAAGEPPGDGALDRAQSRGAASHEPPGQAPGTRRETNSRAGRRSSPSDPSEPKNERELVLASMAGYKPSFELHGLKVGPGPSGRTRVLRQDGTPASEAEVRAVREQVRRDPKALMKRPDFFDVLPRKEFQSLKRAYHARPALQQTHFKHVGLTPSDRDFQWDRSCSKLSGDCNPHAKKNSYKRGTLLEPEELREAGDGVDGESVELDLDDDEDVDWEWEIDEGLESRRTRSKLGGGLRRREGGLLGSLIDSIGKLGGRLKGGRVSSAAPAEATGAVDAGRAPAAVSAGEAQTGRRGSAAPKRPRAGRRASSESGSRLPWLAGIVIGIFFILLSFSVGKDRSGPS